MLDSFCLPNKLIKAEITDWERMIEQNITPFFISSRIMLSLLDNKSSMYFTISNYSLSEQNRKNMPGNLVANIQDKIAEAISSELTGIKTKYHHISFYTISHDDSIKGNIQLPGDYIIRLYEQINLNNDAVFQNLPLYIPVLNNSIDK